MSADVSVAAGRPTMTTERRYRGAFFRLYRSEVRLLLRRRRNLVMLAALAVVPILIGIAVKVTGADNGGPPFLDRITANGLFLVFTALVVSLPLFFPLVIGVVAGDSIAGEAGLGTLRYLLTVPVGRGRLLTAKSLAVLTFTVITVMVVAVFGLLTGWVLFGIHAMVLLSGSSIGVGTALLRLLAVVAYVAVALFALAAGGLLISTLTENPLAAMASTVGLAILSQVLDAVPQLSGIHPGLLTHNWLGFGELLRNPVDGTELLKWSLIHLGYIAVFLSLAWARMTTKDVTS